MPGCAAGPKPSECRWPPPSASGRSAGWRYDEGGDPSAPPCRFCAHDAGISVWRAVVGFRLSGIVHRLQTGTQQRVLGRHECRRGLPAAPRGLVAQGIFPHGRHGCRRRGHRGSVRVVSAAAPVVSSGPCGMGRGLRICLQAAAQFRIICGGAGRVYRDHHRGGRARA